jgi:NlpC/P60 family
MTAITGSQIVTEIEKFKGDAYVYGATGPTSFDCSGLVQYALSSLGVSNVPRTSEEQWGWVTKISASQLQPGDLVFAQFPGDNASPGHVGVYTGNGQILSAEDPAQGVGYSSLASWGSNIVGYGRVPNANASGGAATATDTAAFGGLLSWPTEITSFFNDSNAFIDKLMWLVNPSSWLRIGAFLAGAALLLFAIYALVRAGEGKSLVSMPNVIPVPI